MEFIDATTNLVFTSSKEEIEEAAKLIQEKIDLSGSISCEDIIDLFKGE